LSPERYRTSLYVASIVSEFVPPRVDVRGAVWNYLKKVAAEKELKIIEGEKMQNIVFNGTAMGFRVKDAPRDRLYLLSIRPVGENVRNWRKNDNRDAAKKALDFCDTLGPIIAVGLQGESLVFERASYSQDEMIDVSEWEVSCPCKRPATKENLRDFIRKTGGTRYENVYQRIPEDNEFHIFTDTYIQGGDPLTQLKSVLRDYGEVFGPRSLEISKEFGQKFRRDRKSAFIFLENGEMLEKCYKALKIFFDSNGIPTQYVNDATITDKMKYPGVKANLLLEILTKMGRPPVVLQAPEEMFINDGFLCLSDITSTPRKLFGALFTYSKQGLNVKGEVQIYPDIEFEATEDYIDITEKNIDLLAKKVNALMGGRSLKIDILLTKSWKQENVQRLVKALAENNTETERAYYLSSRTSQFVDDYFESNEKSLRHPYLVLGEKMGFLRTSTDIRFYPHLFSYYVELVWPEDEKLKREDLEKILWLVKKRIYRIQEFYVLKRAEPVYIFNNVRKMYIANIKESLSIPLRLLI